MDRFLSEQLGKPVRVTFGRARTRPILIEYTDAEVRMRLHHAFETAPAEIVDALAAWARNGRRSRRKCELLDAWIDEQVPQLPPRPIRAKPTGEVHDLAAMAGELHGSEFLLDFEASARPDVTWGRRVRSKARRCLQLGSYEAERNVVRIHPVLDRTKVPVWFVRYVLFHEILHAAMPSRNVAGRTIHHSGAFRRRERDYGDYTRAVKWQKRHISSLIRAARRL